MTRRSRSQAFLAVVIALTLVFGAFVGLAAQPTTAQDNEELKGDLSTENWTWPVDDVLPDGTKQRRLYTPIDKAEITRQWNLCVSFPHLKDPYWLAANYGIVEEVKRDGAKMTLFQAGGYTELSTQLSQLDDCVAQGADAVIIGAISFQGLDAKVEEITEKGIPVIDFVNGINSPAVAAHALVSFYDMGATAGEYLKTIIGDEAVKVAFFPGPQGAGWTDTALQGFQDAVQDTGVEIVDIKWGDTGKDIQLKLVEDMLQAHPDLDYIVGNAQAIVSGVQAVREAGREGQVQLLSFYQNPPVYDALVAGDILGCSNDHTVIQARMAVDMAIRLLEGQELEANRSGPVITFLDQDALADLVWESTFAPLDFQPVFTVE